MGDTLANWEARVQALLGKPTLTLVPLVDLDAAIKAAVRRYSKDRPRRTFTDNAGDGLTYEFNMPTGWVNGISAVLAVEYPQGERIPIFLDMAEVLLYPDVFAPSKIRLEITTPAAGKTARVYWSLPFPIPTSDPAVDLVPNDDFEAVVHLAASIVAEALAAEAADTTDPAMPGADIAGFETESEKWRKQADALRAFYLEHLGIEDGPTGISGTTDWDQPSSFLYLGRRWLLRRPRT